VIADGRWNGEMIDTPRGDGGFGYDPYFYIPSLGKCAAELSADEKNACRTAARPCAHWSRS
jgi:XTP/dITP diphosphohydrolase